MARQQASTAHLWERLKCDWRLDPSAQRTELQSEQVVYSAVDAFLASKPTSAAMVAVANLVEALAYVPQRQTLQVQFLNEHVRSLIQDLDELRAEYDRLRDQINEREPVDG